jgi:hypothetical protein
MDKGFLETALSHRTRVIDLLWGGLPVIVSAGDEVGRIVTEAGCGVTVPAGDRKAVAEAIIRILKDKKTKDEMSRKGRELVNSRYQWSKAVEPLNRFLADPKLAADRQDPKIRDMIRSFPNDDTAGSGPDLDQMISSLGLLGKIRMSLRQEGVTGLAKRSARAFRRRAKGE